ncbi:MAG TPA: hypothetical protein VE338_16995 [Ktedonobacterales bacterium]|jgi:hypothetical protein|nr:hypothetical protein [Ktedonobacterales bacterium]
MSLRFELGDADAPRGHAILYARLSGPGERYVATYCVTLPIAFSLGKYLPPMFAGQLPLDALGEGAEMSAMPIPPMLEEVGSYETLRQMAEARGDDLCDIGTLLITDDSQRMAFAAEASAEYGQRYARYQTRWPTPRANRGQTPSPSSSAASSASASGSAGSSLNDLDPQMIVASALPERDRLGEMARLAGQARYAMDGHDARVLEEVSGQLRMLASTLPEKYRAEQLAEAAIRPDETGARLAELYLQRAYRLLDEDYISIPPIEQKIRDLREESGA